MKCQRRLYVAEYSGFSGVLCGSLPIEASNFRMARNLALDWLESLGLLPVESMRVRLVKR